MGADAYPDFDVFRHDSGPGCVCGPAEVVMTMGEGLYARPLGSVWVHHALDAPPVDPADT